MLTVCALVVLGDLRGQTGNPFELAPRTRADSAAVRAPSPADTRTDNPFELTREAASPASAPATSPLSAPKRERSRLPLFLILLGLLVYFALMMNYYRWELQVSLQALVQDGTFTQLFREREARSNVPFRLYYIFFLLNAGLFTLQGLKLSGHDLKGPIFLWFAGFFVLYFALYFAKRTILRLLRILFPGKRGINLYHFTIILFGTTMGLILFPANLLLPFLPENAQWGLLIVAGAATLVPVILRLLRSLVIVGQFFLGHKFHFLLYICTVEIAPVLVVLKLIQNILASPIGTFQ